MPKRILDGDGLWRSDKLALLKPESWRAEYANLIPLALANGAFEANPRRIWALVYSYNRPGMTPENVEALLNELERVKLLFRWTDPATKKPWGYWVGIEKPGRLPGPSRRGKNEVIGSDPPTEEYRKFLDSSGIQNLPSGNEKLLGLGSGLGSGSGTNVVANAQHQSARTNPTGSNAISVSQALCSANAWSGKSMLYALEQAIVFQAKKMPGIELELVGELLVKAYFDHKSAKGSFARGPQKFFEQGLYSPIVDRATAKLKILKDNPATHALAQMEAS